MAPGVKLEFDHVALAANDATPVLELLVGQLGATVLYGAVDRGFRWVLLHAGDERSGMLIELLEPWAVEQDPFLARFLERRGEGAHHLTVKTSDIRATIGALRAAGRPLVDERLDSPAWQEVFVSPRDAYGTVVQVVQTTIARPPVADLLDVARGPEPAALDRFAGGVGSQVAEHWWTAPGRRPDPVALRCVVFAAADAEAAASFYEDLLGGERVASGPADRIELAWPSGAHVAFEPAGDGATGIAAFEFEPPAFEPCAIGQTALTFRPPDR